MRLFSWRAFIVFWVSLALLPVVPSFQDGVLSNLSPVGLAYLALVVAPTRAPALVVAVIGLHLAASLVATLLTGMARRRLSASQFTAVTVVSIAVGLFSAVWVVRSCWPEQIFFDASNIYYDVSDLVRSPSRPDAPFASAEEVTSRLLERTANSRKHYMPCTIRPISNKPTIIAWGTWPEHYHFRSELAAIRHE